MACAMCAEGALRTHRYAAAEWCYNVEDGCRRYAFDADLDLFLAALQGHAPESAWRQQQELCTNVRVRATKNRREDKKTCTE